jgi:hypothetical protein
LTGFIDDSKEMIRYLANKYYLVIGYIDENTIRNSDFETIGYFENVNYKWACIYFLFLDKL